MKTAILFCTFLTWTLLSSAAPDSAFLSYRPSNLTLSPSNTLSSNLFGAGGIVVYKGANGVLTFSNSVPSSSGTNLMVQTNGVNMGNVGTVNWTSGVTGTVSGAVATLGVSASGGGGPSSIITNGSQFGPSVTITLKDGASTTNLSNTGTLNATNPPGGTPKVRLWQTNGTAYTEVTVPSQWLPTNSFVLSVTNPTAGQVLKISSVTMNAGVASIILTNDTDNNSGSGSTQMVATAIGSLLETNTISLLSTNLGTNAAVTFDLLGPSIGHYGISGDSTISLINVVNFTNFPGSRLVQLVIRQFGVSGTLTITPVGPHSIDYGSGGLFIAQNSTNTVSIWWDGLQFRGSVSHVATTGSGAYALSNAPSFYAPKLVLGSQTNRVAMLDASGRLTNVFSTAASTEYLHPDGSPGTPAGGAGGGAQVTNVALLTGSTTNLVIDLGLASTNHVVFKVAMLTNSHVILSNALLRAYPVNVVWQQDTNGIRTILSLRSTDGLIQTNSATDLSLTTNANAMDVWTISSAYFTSNAVAESWSPVLGGGSDSTNHVVEAFGNITVTNTVTQTGGGTAMKLAGAVQFTSIGGNIADADGAVHILVQKTSAGGGTYITGSDAATGLTVTNNGEVYIEVGQILPKLTASRVMMVNAQGRATNVTSSSASTEYVHADGSAGTPAFTNSLNPSENTHLFAGLRQRILTSNGVSSTPRILFAGDSLIGDASFVNSAANSFSEKLGELFSGPASSRNPFGKLWDGFVGATPNPAWIGTNWFAPITWGIAEGQYVTFITWTNVNLIQVAWIKQAAGNSSLGIWTNGCPGCTFSQALAIDGFSATPVGAITNIAVPLGVFSVKLLTQGGAALQTNVVIHVSGQQTNSGGASFFLFGKGGSTMTNFIAVPTAVKNPILAGLAPDVFFWQGVDIGECGGGAGYTNALNALYASVTNACGTSVLFGIVGISHGAVDVSGDFDMQNSLARLMCQRNGWIYLDGSMPHTFYATNLSADTVHYSPAGAALGGANIGQQLGLFSPMTSVASVFGALNATNWPAVANVTLLSGSTTNLVIDLGLASTNHVVFKVGMLTNSHVILSNASTRAFPVDIIWQQDTNGNRSILSLRSTDGLILTNAPLLLTTNASGIDAWRVYSSYFTTNVTVDTGKPGVLSTSATLDFPSTSVGAVADLRVAVAGAEEGDIVAVGVPTGSITAINGSYSGFASNASVFVRFIPTAAAQDPASGTFKVVVTKF